MTGLFFFSEWGENSPGIWPYDGHTTRAKPLVGTAFNGIVARKMPGEPKRVHASRYGLQEVRSRDTNVAGAKNYGRIGVWLAQLRPAATRLHTIVG